MTKPDVTTEEMLEWLTLIEEEWQISAEELKITGALRKMVEELNGSR